LSFPLIQKLISTNFWFRKIPQVINIVLFMWMMGLLVRSGRTETVLANE